MFVIVHDGGYEGHSPPIMAFADLETAKSALVLMEGCCEIFEVPIWPSPALGKWWELEPVWPVKVKKSKEAA